MTSPDAFGLGLGTVGASLAQTSVPAHCLKRFVEEQQAAAAPHVKAANAAVDEFSRAVKIHNDQIDAMN